MSEDNQKTGDNTTTVRLTLSRAHAVVNRLRHLAQEKRGEAMRVLRGLAVDAEISVKQQEELLARGQAAREQLNEAQAAITVAMRLRQMVGQANVEEGISQALAEMAALRQLIAIQEEVIATDTMVRVQPGEVNTALARRSTGYNGERIGSVSVSVLSLEDILAYRNKRNELRARLDALSDQVAKLNGRTLTFEMDSDLAAAVGLS